MRTAKTLLELWGSSPFTGSNSAYLESLYETYLNNPNQVGDDWRELFDNLPKVNGNEHDVSHARFKEMFRGFIAATPTETDQHKQVKVLQLINAYRFRAHLHANLDPLGLKEPPKIPELTLEYYGLSESDLQTEFDTGSLVGPERATLGQILDIVSRTYCSSIGAEYMHISDTAEKRWLQDYLEGGQGALNPGKEEQLQLLHHLSAAEGMERYLHIKYVGQKRFSLEGAESLIPLLHTLINRSAENGVEEMAIGMAHRGRLNVLINVMGKTPDELFKEFEGRHSPAENGTGDVKYHMGFSSDLQTPHGPLHVSLAFNPSHLEIVSPVVEGSVRARQDRRRDKQGSKVVPVLIHGDAAFAGQGVVMETFNMSQSRGFSTKGTVHIVLNNQIGFTTSNQADARSTYYCTDVAKMVNAPIFHVNGDDPEAVVFVSRLAMDYRARFFKDVVIDMVCYRRHGHSEADEPMATQPEMYAHIRSMVTTRELYADKLIMSGITDAREVAAYQQRYREILEHDKPVVAALIPRNKAKYTYVADWAKFKNGVEQTEIDTSITQQELIDLTEKLYRLPENFKLHPAVKKILESRSQMASGKIPFDWGFAETMAYASIVTQGYPVRLSGQDCGRGTFFHRHAVLHDQATGKTYVPLRNISKDQANFLVINSLLSEEAVLAFEYGYATTDPKTLTIWEAQFGDFANNAQVVIDQFISAGEQKWNRLCGLVMLLPHGLEGQGPEHSSARLERYLQLCAQHNMQVCIPSNAAQIFHLLRRQIMRKSRRPLIVMSPKSLLRLPDAASPLSSITEEQFKLIINDKVVQDPKKVKRVILCSGKVYYDLNNRRVTDNREDVAIIRIEQLYPFPDDELKTALALYPNADTFLWCQEEPMNQGAWYSSQHHMRAAIGEKNHLEYAGRPLLAAPAVGHPLLHKEQLEQMLKDALG